MKAAKFILCLLLVTDPAAAQRTSEGFFFDWGVFEEKRPRQCFAIARPEGAGPRSRASVSVGFWPERGIAHQLHVRLRQPARAGSATLLRIGGRSFQLRAVGENAWLSSNAVDSAVVTAMRVGGAMVVESRSPSGRLLRDRYSLRGAATAIDAAAIGCATSSPLA